MKTQTTFFNPLMTETEKSSSYEVIENEKLSDCELRELSISGSLFSLTIFKNVTFESCVFFASKMENCEFIGCKFKNCKFQFSYVEYCDFHSTTFENCIWDFSPIRNGLFSRCELDAKTEFFVLNGDNRMKSCTGKRPLESVAYKMAA